MHCVTGVSLETRMFVISFVNAVACSLVQQLWLHVVRFGVYLTTLNVSYLHALYKVFWGVFNSSPAK